MAETVYDRDQIDASKRMVFILRSRGMTWAQISQKVGKSPTTCNKYYRDYCREAADSIQGGGQAEIVGEMLMIFRELRQEALRNLTQVDVGSPMRANWLAIAGRRLDAEVGFLVEVGLVQKAADKMELSVRDMRKMSDEEIQREIDQIRATLSLSPVVMPRIATASA